LHRRLRLRLIGLGLAAHAVWSAVLR